MRDKPSPTHQLAVSVDERLSKIEALRLPYKVEEIVRKFDVLKEYCDELLVRLVKLEDMNRDDGK